MGSTPEEQIPQVPTLQRPVVDEHADHVHPHGLDVGQIPFDDVGIVGLGVEEELEVLIVLDAHARRGHVVDAVGVPGLAVEDEVPLRGCDELGFGRSGPDGHGVLEVVDDVLAHYQVDRHYARRPLGIQGNRHPVAEGAAQARRRLRAAG